MQNYRRIPLLLLLFSLLACDSKSIEDGFTSLSSEGSELIRPIKKSYEQPLKDIEETAQAVQATKEAVQTIEKGYKKTAATMQTVGKTISSTHASARKSVQSIAGRVPRSQKEANRIVYHEGREYISWIRGAIERFVAKNSLGKARRRRHAGRKHTKS